MKIRLVLACWISVSAISMTGCGDDGTSPTGSNGSMGGSGSATTSATDSEGTADTGSATESSAGGSTGEVMSVCADGQVCDPGDVCVSEVFDAPCQNYDPETEECPADTIATACGGAGGPCCCGTADPTAYACLTPTGCSGTADCECLGDICAGAKVCEAIGGTFQCASPPEA